jgi:hypothetical protein
VEKEIRSSIDPRLDPPGSPGRSRSPSKETGDTPPGEPPAGKLIDAKDDSDQHV